MTENRINISPSGEDADADSFDPTGSVGWVLTKLAPPSPGAPPGFGWRSALSALFNLSNGLYVDKSTSVPAPLRNGNIEAPFSTLGAAIAAAIVLGIPCVITATPGDYSAEVIPAMPAAALSIVSTDVALHSWSGAGVILPHLPAGCPALCLCGCAYRNTQASNVLLVDCTYNGVLTAGTLYSFESLLDVTNVTSAFYSGGTQVGLLTATGSIDARNLQIQSEIRLPNAVGGVDCNFTNCSWQNAAPTNLGNALAGTSVIKMRNCDFRRGIKLTLLSAGGGTIDIDTVSYGSLLTSGTLAADIQLALSLGSSPHPSGVLALGTKIVAGTVGLVTVTMPGVPADVAFAYASSIPLDVGLCVSSIYRSAADTVTIAVFNPTAADITVAANITFRVSAL